MTVAVFNSMVAVAASIASLSSVVCFSCDTAVAASNSVLVVAAAFPVSLSRMVYFSSSCT